MKALTSATLAVIVCVSGCSWVSNTLVTRAPSSGYSDDSTLQVSIVDDFVATCDSTKSLFAVGADEVLKVLEKALKEEAKRYSEEYSVTSALLLDDPIQYIEVRRQVGDETAMRLVLRAERGPGSDSMELSPALLEMSKSFVKVAGVPWDEGADEWQRSGWGWLFPWMWIHRVAGVLWSDAYSVKVNFDLDIEAVLPDGLSKVGRYEFSGLIPDVRSGICIETVESLEKARRWMLWPAPAPDKRLGLNVTVRVHEQNPLGQVLEGVAGLL